MAKKKRTRKRPGDPGETFARVKMPRELDDPRRRQEWGLPTSRTTRGPYIIELNLQHAEGLPGARAALEELCRAVAGGGVRLRRVAKTYYACRLTVSDVHRLAAADERRSRNAAKAARAAAPGQPPIDAARYAAIFRIWPDFKVKSHIDRSVATVKADAAYRAYAAAGDGIVWAVVDSGVDASHPHFGNEAGSHTLLDPSVASLHRCFCEVRT